MTRTAEQQAADDQLTAAIEAVNEAYYGTDGLILEYVVVFAERQAASDETAAAWLVRDAGVPPHRVLGLLDYASTRIRAHLSTMTHD